MGNSLLRPASDWMRDVRWAIKWGLLFAVVFSAIAFITHIGQTENLVGGFGLGTIVLFYLFSAIVGGVAIGSLLPLARRGLLAQMFVGFVTMVPLSGAIVFLARDQWRGSRAPLWSYILIIAGILGPLYAWAFWYASRRTRSMQRAREQWERLGGRPDKYDKYEKN